jgi:hypothetical protein
MGYLKVERTELLELLSAKRVFVTGGTGSILSDDLSPPELNGRALTRRAVTRVFGVCVPLLQR